MNKTTFHWMCAALLAVGVSGCAETHPPGPAIPSEYPAATYAPHAQVIEGQVVQADADGYIIREASGRQTRVRIDRSTIRDNIAVGDYVLVRFAGPPPTSYATSVTRTTAGTVPAVPLTVPATPIRTVEGTFIQQQGSFYVIRDISGRDMFVHVDGTSRIDPSIRPGDRVVASVRGMPYDASALPPAPLYANDVYRIDRRGEDSTGDVILGEVLRTDDDRYLVRDTRGRDVTLLVDNTTKLNRNIKAGDQVVAVNANPANSPYERNIYSMYRRNNVEAVEGEVIRTDTDGYVVRDATGREVRFWADPATLRNRNIRVGDRVVVYLRSAAGTLHADAIDRR